MTHGQHVLAGLPPSPVFTDAVMNGACDEPMTDKGKANNQRNSQGDTSGDDESNQGVTVVEMKSFFGTAAAFIRF